MRIFRGRVWVVVLHQDGFVKDVAAFSTKDKALGWFQEQVGISYPEYLEQHADGKWQDTYHGIFEGEIDR